MKRDVPAEEVEGVTGSEDALAAEFAMLFQHLFRYTPGMGWMRCLPHCWVRDDAMTAFDCARQVARYAALAEPNKKAGRAISSAKTIGAIVTIAKSDPRLTLAAEEWDAEPHEFNVPDGVIDLRNGSLTARDTDQYFTRCATVSPAFGAPRPTWDRFLLDVFCDDAEMVEFVQRMVGYMLTGDRREQKIFFLQGVGANGKSTLVDFVSSLAGSYTIKLPAHVLMHSQLQGHPTELAQLRGKRLAVSSEIEEGQHWAESRIKELTGDETLTARFMRQDFFEFRQGQKHLVVGNHKPRLRGGDAAIARRFVLVPFPAKFAGDKRDPNMLAKLRDESEAVLAWAIEGAIKWYASGLAIPGSVTAASQAYMEENDDLSAWIEENCVLLAGVKTQSTPLYGNYVSWLKTRGQHAPAIKTWGDRMSVVTGIERRKSHGVVVYIGIALRADEHIDYPHRGSEP